MYKDQSPLVDQDNRVKKMITCHKIFKQVMQG